MGPGQWAQVFKVQLSFQKFNMPTKERLQEIYYEIDDALSKLKDIMNLEHFGAMFSKGEQGSIDQIVNNLTARKQLLEQIKEGTLTIL